MKRSASGGPPELSVPKRAKPAAAEGDGAASGAAVQATKTAHTPRTAARLGWGRGLGWGGGLGAKKGDGGDAATPAKYSADAAAAPDAKNQAVVADGGINGAPAAGTDASGAVPATSDAMYMPSGDAAVGGDAAGGLRQGKRGRGETPGAGSEKGGNAGLVPGQDDGSDGVRNRPAKRIKIEGGQGGDGGANAPPGAAKTAAAGEGEMGGAEAAAVEEEELVLPAKEKILANMEKLDQELERVRSKLRVAHQRLGRGSRKSGGKSVKIDPPLRVHVATPAPDELLEEITVSNMALAEQAQLGLRRISVMRRYAVAENGVTDVDVEEEEPEEDEAALSHRPALLRLKRWAKQPRRFLRPEYALPLYHSPEEVPQWEANAAAHKSNFDKIKAVVRERKSVHYAEEQRLAQEYLAKKRTWVEGFRAWERRKKEGVERSAEAGLVGQKGALGEGFDGAASGAGKGGEVKEEDKGKGEGKSSIGESRTSPRHSNSNKESGGTDSAPTPVPATRSGDVVRSEYEQEKLLQQMLEQERRKNLYVKNLVKCPPMMIDDKTKYHHSMAANFNSRLGTDALPARCRAVERGEPCLPRCNCARAAEKQRQGTNPWTDLEKCIFIDRFLQYPKNFHKISQFLVNKSCKDCVEYYYDSKFVSRSKAGHGIPYKALLLEQHKRRRGNNRHSWQLSRVAAHIVGVDLPDDDEEEGEGGGGGGRRKWTLAAHVSDNTYSSIDNVGARHFGRAQQAAELRQRQQEQQRAAAAQREIEREKEAEEAARKEKQEAAKAARRARSAAAARRAASNSSGNTDGKGTGGRRRVVQKWSAEEKAAYVTNFKVLGKDWEAMAQVIPTKSVAQIKNYYQNYKVRLGLDKLAAGVEGSGATTDAETAKAKAERARKQRERKQQQRAQEHKRKQLQQLQQLLQLQQLGQLGLGGQANPLALAQTLALAQQAAFAAGSGSAQQQQQQQAAAQQLLLAQRQLALIHARAQAQARAQAEATAAQTTKTGRGSNNANAAQAAGSQLSSLTAGLQTAALQAALRQQVATQQAAAAAGAGAAAQTPGMKTLEQHMHKQLQLQLQHQLRLQQTLAQAQQAQAKQAAQAQAPDPAAAAASNGAASAKSAALTASDPAKPPGVAPTQAGIIAQGNGGPPGVAKKPKPAPATGGASI